jgi:hypothetical protein
MARKNMKTRMNKALNGNFKRRKDEVTGRYILSESEKKDIRNYRETESRERYLWENLYVPNGEGGLKKEIGFFHSFDNQQGILEAFVLIPEEQGLVKVERVVNGSYYENSGFLQPEYKKEAIEAIQDSASRHFEDSTDKFQKKYVMDAAIALIPEDLGVFKDKYRQRMLNGLMSTEFDRVPEIEVLWANLTYTLSKLGFSSKDPDFVKTIWEKSKTIPYGYLYGGYGAQVTLAQELLNKDPNGLMEFEYIRNGLVHSKLPNILSTIPVRKDNVEMEEWRKRRRYPGKEIYAPIVDFMNKTIGKPTKS